MSQNLMVKDSKSKAPAQVGEVWDEMGRELSLDGVRPISPDQEALNAICRMTEDTARRIMTEQSSIVEQQQKEEISEEQLLYTEIKSHWKQRELMAKSWDDYVARTSNYEILKELKAQREKFNESSKPKPEDEDAAVRPAEHFVAHIVSSERTESRGPAGVKVTLGRTSLKSAGQKRTEAKTRDPEYFSTASVRD